MVLILGLSNLAVATPIPGTYTTLSGKLKPGTWTEDFSATGGQMGIGDSHLTGNSLGSSPYQWSIGLSSKIASKYDGTLQPIPGPPTLQATWDWQTPYSGTITIGGSLITAGGNPVPFTMNGINYNVTYGNYGSYLEWEFMGHGTTSDGCYTIDFTAYYYGTPTLTGATITGKLQQASATIAPAPVPEPATMFLLGSGLIGIGVFVRKRFKR